MTPDRLPPTPDNKQVSAYDQMLARVVTRLQEAEHTTRAALQKSIEAAKDTAVELGELTRDEADLLGAYVKRDLEDVGHYLARTGEDLTSWLQFDVQLIETQLLGMFMEAADQTKLAHLQLADQARQASEYRTGEITSVGTLQCAQCGELLRFSATAHIPPCPKCHHTVFTRGET